MATISINTGNQGFLANSFVQHSNPARLCISAETEDFDTETLLNWQNEGFEIAYVPYGDGGKEYLSRLNPRLNALIAYYPTNIPDPRTRFPPTIRVLVHLAGSTVDVTTIPQLLGRQGKRRIITKQIEPGIGTGERLNLSYLSYTYEFSQPGFAEHDLDEYDRVSDELAWTRTLDVLRKAFRKDADLEKPWDGNQEGKYFKSNITNTMETYVSHKHPSVAYAPTLKGGVGANASRRFYQEEFLQPKQPSMRLRLLSRTIGADRVADELYIIFDHTQEMPWILPGVPPTNKRVEIILISIVSLKAGKLYSEHVYWDQASVLVQIGLLDPQRVADGFEGVKSLPVVGREGPRRILHEHPARGPEYHERLAYATDATATDVEKSTERPKSEVKGKGKAVANGNSPGEADQVENTSDDVKQNQAHVEDGPIGENEA
ncbi:hypothetical protein Egran_00858 [Elaphomyces granulatus]|uniref:SnoaL-like domain-containing protein n=1 Tax=Elaphomyces granulatus TaxID=519963 RepID=A0A232M4P1_9EURO|nr:hypothetical protein Egran_00858 [Elaphomyces granulatus]